MGRCPNHYNYLMKNPFTLIDSKAIYKNPWIQVREDKVIRPGGKEGIFGVVTMVAGSTVLPLTSDGYVYLTKEYKYAIGSESTELISGAIDGDETPLEAAQRELQEETGLIAEKWTDLAVVDPFTTVVLSPNHMFLAENLTTDETNLDEGEVINLEKVTFKEALRMVMDGEITHGATCVVILKTALLRKDLY